jgi:hypothetical protein
VSDRHDPPLVGVLLDLGRALGADGSTGDRRDRITGAASAARLDARAAPSWLVDLLTSVKDGATTDWVDFTVPDDDDPTAVLAFVRSLAGVLPVALADDVESLTITFEALDRDAVVSWEGSCYRVAAIGAVWD